MIRSREVWKAASEMPFTVRMYPSQSGKNEYSDSTPARDQANTQAAMVTIAPMINTRIEGGYTRSRSWSPYAHRRRQLIAAPPIR